MAWGDCVRVGRLTPRGDGAGAGGEPRRTLEVVASLQMDCLVAVRPCFLVLAVWLACRFA